MNHIKKNNMKIRDLTRPGSDLKPIACEANDVPLSGRKYWMYTWRISKACSHDPVTIHCPGQLTDPGVNFDPVHGLTPVTVHMSFSLPWATSRGGLPIVQHRVTRLAEVTFLHVNRTQKLPRGKSNLAHAHY